MKKTEIQKHIIFCNNFLEKLKPLQTELLFLKLNEVRPRFEKLFTSGMQHFKRTKENFAGTGRESKYFIFKKQVDLILRYIEDFIIVNQSLEKMSEYKVLSYFEKQFKLKKIIKKHLGDLKELLL